MSAGVAAAPPKESTKREMGVWIDRRKALIAIQKEETRQVTSGMQKHVRYSGAAQEDSAEDQRDRRSTSHRNKYYDEIVACIRDADSILANARADDEVEPHGAVAAHAPATEEGAEDGVGGRGRRCRSS
jgi:hypothetical protein